MAANGNPGWPEIVAAAFRRRRPARMRIGRSGTADRLAALHNGAIGDYATWQTVRAAVLGALVALALT